MDVPSILGQYGLAGVIIAALTSVVAILYKDNKALQKQVVEAQQARVQDAKDTQEKVAVQLELQAKVMDLVYQKLENAKRGA